MYQKLATAIEQDLDLEKRAQLLTAATTIVPYVSYEDQAKTLDLFIPSDSTNIMGDNPQMNEQQKIEYDARMAMLPKELQESCQGYFTGKHAQDIRDKATT